MSGDSEFGQVCRPFLRVLRWQSLPSSPCVPSAFGVQGMGRGWGGRGNGVIHSATISYLLCARHPFRPGDTEVHQIGPGQASGTSGHGSQAAESPGEPVRAEVTGCHPSVSDSVGLRIRSSNSSLVLRISCYWFQNHTFKNHWPGKTEKVIIPFQQTPPKYWLHKGKHVNIYSIIHSSTHFSFIHSFVLSASYKLQALF